MLHYSVWPISFDLGIFIALISLAILNCWWIQTDWTMKGRFSSYSKSLRVLVPAYWVLNVRFELRFTCMETGETNWAFLVATSICFQNDDLSVSIFQRKRPINVVYARSIQSNAIIFYKSFWNTFAHSEWVLCICSYAYMVISLLK